MLAEGAGVGRGAVCCGRGASGALTQAGRRSRNARAVEAGIMRMRHSMPEGVGRVQPGKAFFGLAGCDIAALRTKCRFSRYIDVALAHPPAPSRLREGETTRALSRT